MGKKKMLFLIILLIGVAIFGVYGGKTKIRESSEASKEGIVLAPVISAEGAILVNAEDGRTIYEKNADERLYPASTTKIMTALVALETLDEIKGTLQSKIKVPKEAIGIEGSSVYLKEGEMVTAEELLYGLMLQSGNDAAECIALSFGPTEEEFVKKMNQKAKTLGCRTTNFINPSGLCEENHYTTARDLAMISMAAMERDDFRRIVGTEDWSSASGRNFHNKNKTVSQYEGATGIKIGYTKTSGRTLVASAKRDGVELIAVVLRDPDWFQDAYSLLDYGFARMHQGGKE